MRNLFLGALALMAAVAPAAAQAPTSASQMFFWDGEQREVNAPLPSAPGELWTWSIPQGPYALTVVVSYTLNSNTKAAQLNCRMLYNGNAVVDRATAMVSGNGSGGTTTSGTLTLMSNTSANNPQYVQLGCNSAGAGLGTMQRIDRVAVRAQRYTDSQPLQQTTSPQQQSAPAQSPPPQLTRPRG